MPPTNQMITADEVNQAYSAAGQEYHGKAVAKTEEKQAKYGFASVAPAAAPTSWNFCKDWPTIRNGANTAISLMFWWPEMQGKLKGWVAMTDQVIIPKICGPQ